MNLQSWTGIAGVGAIVAAATAGWSYIRMIVSWASDLVVCRSVVTEEAGDAVVAYCWHNGRRSPFGMRIFGGSNQWVQPTSRRQLIAYENIGSDPVLYLFGWAPVIVRRRTGGDNANIGISNGSDEWHKTVYLHFIRGTVNIDTIVDQAVEHYNHVKQGVNGESKRRRYFVRRLGGNLAAQGHRAVDPSGVREPAGIKPSGGIEDRIAQKTVKLLKWKPQDLVELVPDRSPFHGYAFPVAVMMALDEMRDWIDNEKWFRSKSIPWRRGWLLHGRPGCGKSTLVRAMAMHFDLPVFSIDLSTHDNESFARAWQEIMEATPAIALIEDIDAVFNGRDNVATKNHTRDCLTFDCLLNCISGVGNGDGVFLIVTTNHPDSLDPALGVVKQGQSSRPGRIDRIIELGPMEVKERMLLANHILSDFPDDVRQAIHDGDGMTPAQFQDHCAQIALRKFWEKRRT